LSAAAIAAALLASTAADSYQALKAMEGSWIATTAHRTQTVDNRCVRTGLFLACEQAIGGKPAFLVVFLPKEASARRLVFHTLTLTSAGDRPGAWRELVIEGDRWTYSALEKPRRGERRMRTVDTYSGPDHMHVEVQASANGEEWTPVASESLDRAP
jgi:hypothetical protein